MPMPNPNNAVPVSQDSKSSYFYKIVKNISRDFYIQSHRPPAAKRAKNSDEQLGFIRGLSYRHGGKKIEVRKRGAC